MTDNPPADAVAAAAPATEAAPPEFHLVFQCKACRTIVGDSSYLVNTDETTQTFTLDTAPPSVQEDSELCHSRSGPDMGSSYLKLCCAGCGATIGRKYKATPRAMDDLRDRFTFDNEALISYQLGTDREGNATPRDVATLSSLADAVRAAESEVQGMSAEVLKAGGVRTPQIEEMIVSIVERLDGYETRLARLEAAAPARDAGGGNVAKRGRADA